MDELVGPFVGLADGNDEDQIDIDPGDKDGYKKLISTVLKPHFISLPKIIQVECKINLSYFLTTDKNEFFIGVFASNLLPFDPPTKPKDFFIWLWEELFPNEDYILQDPKKYRLSKDVYEIDRLYRRAEKIEAEAAARLNKDVDDAAK